jgi:hypothetical protein
VRGRKGRTRKQLLSDLTEKRMQETERGNTRLHSVEKSLWKTVWTCRKRDCGVNERKKKRMNK